MEHQGLDGHLWLDVPRSAHGGTTDSIIWGQGMGPTLGRYAGQRVGVCAGGGGGGDWGEKQNWQARHCGGM
jgi:hypothetical protein